MLIYLLFFFFWSFFEIIDLGSELFFNLQQKPVAITAYKVITQICIIILPIFKLSSKFGNLRVTTFSLAIYALVSKK